MVKAMRERAFRAICDSQMNTDSAKMNTLESRASTGFDGRRQGTQLAPQVRGVCSDSHRR